MGLEQRKRACAKQSEEGMVCMAIGCACVAVRQSEGPKAPSGPHAALGPAAGLAAAAHALWGSDSVEQRGMRSKPVSSLKPIRSAALSPFNSSRHHWDLSRGMSAAQAAATVLGPGCCPPPLSCCCPLTDTSQHAWSCPQTSCAPSCSASSRLGGLSRCRRWRAAGLPCTL